MDEKNVSFTSLVTAYVRAYHSMYAKEKIFDDFLANCLIPEDKRKLIEPYFYLDKQMTTFERVELSTDKTMLPPTLLKAAIVLSRARYTEDTLEKDMMNGVKQYLILGSGMDTFAFRRQDLLEQLKVFEVDHPKTQEFKLQRFSELRWKHPDKLYFIPIDFTKENLITVITRSPAYDREAKSLFSWLGVTMYLTRKEILITLSSISKIARVGSKVIFDYLENDAFNPEKSHPEIKKRFELLKKIGEPMITGLNPLTLAEDLANLGFRLDENLSPKDIEKRYFQGRTDGFHAQMYEYIAYATLVKP
jgi:methyltransferase (TIGR00027 family)